VNAAADSHPHTSEPVKDAATPAEPVGHASADWPKSHYTKPAYNSSAPWPPSTPPAAKARMEQGEMPESFWQSDHRMVKLTRTLASRNVEIARKGLNTLSKSLKDETDRISKAVSSTDIATPTKTFQDRASKTARQVSQDADKWLERLQKDLETNDVAVIVTTLILIVACVALVLIISGLGR
jgi:hypothetical protein